jgi:hypothetical protein
VATCAARLLHEYLLYLDSLPPDLPAPPPDMKNPTGFKIAGAFYEKYATAILPSEVEGFSVLGEPLSGAALEAQSERLQLLEAEPLGDVAFQMSANAMPLLPAELDLGRRRAPDAPPSSAAYKADVGAMARYYQLHSAALAATKARFAKR